jgi:hypothetical protein
MPPFGKPGPTLSLRDESPAGKNRGGTPAGERARKRRAAQAALLRGASRTPLACGHQHNASAGVPLSFSAGSESISGVSLTKQLQSFAPNCFVALFVVTGKTRALKTRRENEQPHPEAPAPLARLRASSRRYGAGLEG